MKEFQVLRFGKNQSKELCIRVYVHVRGRMCVKVRGRRWVYSLTALHLLHGGSVSHLVPELEHLAGLARQLAVGNPTLAPPTCWVAGGHHPGPVFMWVLGI